METDLRPPPPSQLREMETPLWTGIAQSTGTPPSSSQRAIFPERVNSQHFSSCLRIVFLKQENTWFPLTPGGYIWPHWHWVIKVLTLHQASSDSTPVEKKGAPHFSMSVWNPGCPGSGKLITSSWRWKSQVPAWHSRTLAHLVLGCLTIASLTWKSRLPPSLYWHGYGWCLFGAEQLP